LYKEFSPHERSLLIPVDKGRNPALAKIQKANAKTYEALLKSKRFQGWREVRDEGDEGDEEALAEGSQWKDDDDDFALKLTMCWFGLPVEPLRLKYWKNWDN